MYKYFSFCILVIILISKNLYSQEKNISQDNFISRNGNTPKFKVIKDCENILKSNINLTINTLFFKSNSFDTNSVNNNLFAKKLEKQTQISEEIDFTKSQLFYNENIENIDSINLHTTFKSPITAGLLSALIPGSGQIYNNSNIWRTALYMVLEGGAWYSYFYFTKQGNTATTNFENYADSHWDVERYISWIKNNYNNWSSEEADTLIIKSCLDSIYKSTNANLKSYERIDFEKLHRIERAIKPFSHTLYSHGEQQYYEMIGKYSQYRAGWDDHNFSADTVNIYDPSFTSKNNTDYTYQRANANKILGYTNLAIATLILNHFASGVDAYVSAVSNNKININSKSEIRLNKNFDYEFLTSLTLKINF